MNHRSAFPVRGYFSHFSRLAGDRRAVPKRRKALQQMSYALSTTVRASVSKEHIERKTRHSTAQFSPRMSAWLICSFITANADDLFSPRSFLSCHTTSNAVTVWVRVSGIRCVLVLGSAAEPHVASTFLYSYPGWQHEMGTLARAFSKLVDFFGLEGYGTYHRDLDMVQKLQ